MGAGIRAGYYHETIMVNDIASTLATILGVETPSGSIGRVLTETVAGVGGSQYNSSMDLRPLHDRVLVRRLDEGEQMRGGIIIPDTAKEKPQQAEVKAVGNGKLLENGRAVALEVKPGDRILFGKYSGCRNQDRRRGVPDSEGRRDPRGPWNRCANLRI